MSKNTRNRILLTAVAALLLVVVAIGGTVAWLIDTSDEVTNTFTATDLEVLLDETPTNSADDTWSQPLLPGQTYNKDPNVKLDANSVDGWVFVEICETNNTLANSEKKVNYTVDTNNWVQVKNGGNAVTTSKDGSVSIWMYKTNALTASSDPVYLLTGGTNSNKPGSVTVNTDVTEADMAAPPTITFYAYALQSANLAVDVDGVATDITPNNAATYAYQMWQLLGGN